MKVAVTLLLAGLLALVAAIASAMLVPACGVDTAIWRRWLNHCDLSDDLEAKATAQRLDIANSELLQEIMRLERELASMQCVAAVNEPPVADPPLRNLPTFTAPDPPDASEEPDYTPSQADADAWRRQDLDALTGCWDLDSDYRVQHLETGEVTHFNEWRICFRADGTGSQEMRGTNGTTCSGPVSVAFSESGQLVINEPDNLPCSDETYIYQRKIACALQESGIANCGVNQPEIQRSTDMRIRRLAGDE